MDELSFEGGYDSSFYCTRVKFDTTRVVVNI